MCGITGIFNFSDSVIPDDTILSMRDEMIHRGPDDSGVWISPDQKCFLAHRRLSIIDLSENAKQPMTNENGKVVITYNGEIYNYLKLRNDLEKKGHFFKSQSDTESLLHLYEDKGFDLLNYLEGMYSFCIYDADKELLFLARDPFGEKPLYYSVINGVFIFASEIKALLKFPALKPEINLSALPLYLNFLTVPAPHTLFRNISKLPNGYCLTVDKQGNLSAKQYYNPAEIRSTASDNFIEAEGRLETLLENSIKDRMISDVPYGVFLSGGIDSSTNVALMSSFTEKPVNTFSVSIRNDNISDENIFAKLVADKFKTNHHEIIIDTNDFLSLFDSLAYYQDEPLADPVCVPLYYVARLAKNSGVKVIQLGEGSDEIFAGYGHYQMNLRRERYFQLYNRIIPGYLKRTLYKSGSILIDNPIFHDVLLRTTLPHGFYCMGSSIAFYDKQVDDLLYEDSEYTTGGYNYINELYSDAGLFLNNYKNGKRSEDLLFRFIYLELAFRIPELLLMRVDKMLMANSIEGRAPYLQKDLVKYAVSLPIKYKLNNGEGKYILKKLMRDKLPEIILTRKKVGFCGSASNMLNDKIKSYAYELLINQEILKEWIKTDKIKKLFIKHSYGNSGDSLRIWSLLNLALWVKQWL